MVVSLIHGWIGKLFAGRECGCSMIRGMYRALIDRHSCM